MSLVGDIIICILFLGLARFAIEQNFSAPLVQPDIQNQSGSDHLTRVNFYNWIRQFYEAIPLVLKVTISLYQLKDEKFQ